MIKNFDGSDEMAILASQMVRVTITILSRTATKHGVSFSFLVSGGITLVEGSKMCYKEVEVVYKS